MTSVTDPGEWRCLQHNIKNGSNVINVYKQICNLFTHSDVTVDFNTATVKMTIAIRVK